MQALPTSRQPALRQGAAGPGDGVLWSTPPPTARTESHAAARPALTGVGIPSDRCGQRGANSEVQLQYFSRPGINGILPIPKTAVYPEYPLTPLYTRLCLVKALAVSQLRAIYPSLCLREISR